MDKRKRGPRSSTRDEPAAKQERGPFSSAVHAAADLASSAAETVTNATARPVGAVSAAVSDVADAVEGIGSAVGSRARPVIEEVVQEVGDVAKGARRLAQRRPKGRRPKRNGRVRLPSLYQVHPEARNAAPRERGVQVVPLDEIAGTTVTSVARAMDFLPMRAARTTNWEARWDRILRAVDELKPLPPIDVFRYGGRYWVADGHNRVAAALRVGQLGIDANVTDLVGDGQSEPATPIAAYLGESTDLRAAGAGRRLHRHADRQPTAAEGAPASARSARPPGIEDPAAEPGGSDAAGVPAARGGDRRRGRS